MRRSVARLLVGAATALALPAAAIAETRVSADVGASLGYSSNPFSVERNSVFGDSGGSFYYELSAEPRVSWVGETSTLTAGAYARYQDYFTSYDSTDSYGASLRHDARLSERLTSGVRLSYDNAVLGAGRAPGFSSGVIGIDPVADGGLTPLDPTLGGTLLPDGNDIGLFGARTRTITYQASGDLSYAASSRDTFTVSGFGTAARYKSRQFSNDYNAYGGSLGYRRSLSEALTVGVRASVAQYDYKTLLIPDSRIVTLAATFDYRASERFRASGEIGTTLVDDAGPGGTSTPISGSLRLCRTGSLDELCLGAARNVSPTGFAGTRTQTSVDGSYNRRLSERGTIFASASYVRSGAGQVATVLGTRNFSSDFADASAGYRHRLSERLSVTGSGFYRRVTGGGRNIPDSAGGLLTLGYRLGDTR